MLIIFDRMYGTFEPEDEPVVYGLVHPITTYDPIWTQTEHFVGIFKQVLTLPHWWQKLGGSLPPLHSAQLGRFLTRPSVHARCVSPQSCSAARPGTRWTRRLPTVPPKWTRKRFASISVFSLVALSPSVSALCQYFASVFHSRRQFPHSVSMSLSHGDHSLCVSP